VVGIARGPASPWRPCPSPIRVVSGGSDPASSVMWVRALGYLSRSRVRASVLPALRTSVLRGSEGPGDRASTARAQGPAGWGDVICLGLRGQPARQALQVFVTVNSPAVTPRSGQSGAGGPAWGPNRTTTSQTHGDHERLHGHKVPAHAEASAQRPTNSSCADPRALPVRGCRKTVRVHPRGARQRSGIPDAHHGDNKFRCRTLRGARRIGAGERDRWRGSSLIGCTDGLPFGYPSDSSCGRRRAGRRALSTTQDRFSFILDRSLVTGKQSARARGTPLRLRLRRRSPSSPPSSVRVAAARAAVLGLVRRLLRPAPSRRGMGRGRSGYRGLLPRRTSWPESRSVGRAPPPAASLVVHGGRGLQSRRGSAHEALW
jgi:hypothetical protein